MTTILPEGGSIDLCLKISRLKCEIIDKRDPIPEPDKLGVIRSCGGLAWYWNNSNYQRPMCGGFWFLPSGYIDDLENYPQSTLSGAFVLWSKDDDKVISATVFLDEQEQITFTSSDLWITKEHIGNINKAINAGKAIQSTYNNNEISERTENLRLAVENIVSRPEMRKQLIIKEIKAMGFDPLNLPKRQNGKAGIRAKIKKTLLNSSANLFTESTFNSSWQELRDDEKLQEIK